MQQEAWNELFAEILELYPKTFFPRGQKCKPLKIGIHHEMPEISSKHKSAFLNYYTSQRRYWLALTEGAVRVDSNGKPDGVVTAEAAAIAAGLLAATAWKPRTWIVGRRDTEITL